MKILFTGMGSSHCSPSKNVGFFNALGKILSSNGHTVEWKIPRLDWDESTVSEYDQVIFGLTPLTSPSANRAYAALSFLEKVYHSPKLKLVIDSPQLWQYKLGIRAVANDPIKAIFNPFFLKRYDYLSASRDSSVVANIQKVAEKLQSELWPTTLYPALPWSSSQKVANSMALPGVASSLAEINLDSFLLIPQVSKIDRIDSWAADDSRLSWVKQTSEALSMPVMDVRVTRSFDDSAALSTISQSVGLLFPPQDRGCGTWWSYRVVQAMNSHTPVATNWSDTIEFSKPWSLLAYQIEDMKSSDRADLAKEQKIQYESAIPKKSEVLDILNKLLKVEI